jgi:hypothetical protein
MKRLAVVWSLLFAVGVATTGVAAVSNPIASVLPPPIERAEALAEDVQTDVEQKAWSAADAKLLELRSVGAKLAAAGVAPAKRSAYGSALGTLSAAIDRRSQGDALTAGNRVSRVVTGIMADYPTKVPVAVTYMDVAGRDALYAGQQGRWGDAANAAAEVGKDYAAVQAHIRSRDAALDRQVTGEIGQLRSAVDSHARDRVARLARALLEDVDRIERVF